MRAVGCTGKGARDVGCTKKGACAVGCREQGCACCGEPGVCMPGDVCSAGCSERESRASVWAHQALWSDAVELPGSSQARALAPVASVAEPCLHP